MRENSQDSRIKLYKRGAVVSFWVLLQILIDIVLMVTVVGLWIRLNRPAKEDPRLSKGLQLLQSKIAVLEDLSDRTETQVNQLTTLIEQKVKDVQNKIQAADKQIVKIEQNMQKSLEVAKIFQDRIPHTEILERQNTIKYVKAARLAHQGQSVDEIASQVDLSRGEIEFIAKVNRDELMFCEDSLPEWIADEAVKNEIAADDDLSDVDNISFMNPLLKESNQDISSAFEIPNHDNQSLKKLGDAFKAACKQVDEDDVKESSKGSSISDLFAVTQNIAQNFLGEKPTSVAPTAIATVINPSSGFKNEEAIVRSVEFPRIDLTKDLG